jgi:glutamyl-tRNA synthetase
MRNTEEKNMTDRVRVRFAPSPTGYLHVGGARTALFNYLFARHQKGDFLLRIEDTDRSRYQESALLEIYQSLRWLGIDWDEGPEKGGQCGPYVQSQRTELYREHAQRLIDGGAAYRCFCTPERLSQLRITQEKEKLPLGYDRHCRNLLPEEEKRLFDSKAPYIVRLKIPLGEGEKVVFEDRIRGAIEYSTSVLDDLVLLKSDGFPTYHLANVVDDHFMEITHVLRGDEWITSTPRHVLLYKAFGWTPPQFAHMPVILSPDGGKLSKRKGAASVMDYQRAGFLPEALFNFLALLGWSPGEGDPREIMTRDELIEAFSLDHISPKAAVFDEKKLEWMNGKYLEERTAESLVPEVTELFKKSGVIADDLPINDAYMISVIALLKGRSKHVTDIAQSGVYFFRDPDVYEEKAKKKYFNAEAVGILQKIATILSEMNEFSKSEIEKKYHESAQEIGASLGALVHPTRLAISGVSFGPGLFEMMEVLGKETVLRRIDQAVEDIKRNAGSDGVVE